MVPSANLLGFAGQELGRKLPHVIGTIIETTLGSLVEIILFMVLISRGNEYVFVIKAAILGSILANLLLCLGTCFFAGGMRRDEQEFHEAVSEVGSNLMLVAGSKSLMMSLHIRLSCTDGDTQWASSYRQHSALPLASRPTATTPL